MKIVVPAFVVLFCSCFFCCSAEDGYELWLRYRPLQDPVKLEQYKKTITSVSIIGKSPTLNVLEQELERAFLGLMGKSALIGAHQQPALLIGSARQLALESASIQKKLNNLGNEGYIITHIQKMGRKQLIITANTDQGVLYGGFHFIRLLQTHQDLTHVEVVSKPALQLRLLNHWDNLNRTVERGYAGFSIWKWHLLPDYIDPRYNDYARANASIGINGTVLSNVNANATLLTPPYLLKVKALADVFRPFGIKVYLTARFSAPIEIGGLHTADPLNNDVQQWWSRKIAEIYALIPDFGGFLVKANSEGQPGPQDYKRSHAEGANMLADALAPFQGIVMWRAFVYSQAIPDDRAKQAYNEFQPLDGKFRKNVVLQVKNGPIDFMPREPFHPLLGAMPKTATMLEFQLTQEYLGQGTHLVYLAPLFKECLDSDTWRFGKGSTVAKVIDGSLGEHQFTGIAGVANIGTDRNWTGHPFAQANWYALGRLCWNPTVLSEEIAKEWIKMTFSNTPDFVNTIATMMMRSREILVNYMNPLGLHHIMASNHHYGPGPWVDDLPRADWNPVYYHKAEKEGIGFDRTPTGSNALAQYAPGARALWEHKTTISDKFLLWFHHVPWDYKMKSGRTLWEELCERYNAGVDRVGWMCQIWDKQKSRMDRERFDAVTMLLQIQTKEAKWWRDACLSYFSSISGKAIPAKYPQPEKSLEYYKSLQFPYAPGINNVN